MAADENPEQQQPRRETSQDLEPLLALIRRAFTQARDSGKEDWHRMYAGVLKNRMLLLTDGDFDEAEWGASGFTTLLELFRDVLRVDRGVKPPIVELLDRDQLELPIPDALRGSLTRPFAAHPTTEHPTSDSRRWRIRRDLWDAVLGVRDPDAFVWEEGTVIRVPQDEALGHAGPRLPTLTGPELDAWQSEYAGEQPTDARFSSVLESWARGDTPTATLPRHLQHLWYARLKRLVRERLESWFQENSLLVPGDMIELPATGRVRQSDPTSALRALVLACVRVMTEEELRDLRLPPSAILRSRH